ARGSQFPPQGCGLACPLGAAAALAGVDGGGEDGAAVGREGDVVAGIEAGVAGHFAAPLVAFVGGDGASRLEGAHHAPSSAQMRVKVPVSSAHGRVAATSAASPGPYSAGSAWTARAAAAAVACCAGAILTVRCPPGQVGPPA